MRRRTGLVGSLTIFTLAFALWACQDTTRPQSTPARTPASRAELPTGTPGDSLAPGANGSGQLVACTQRPFQTGSAIIGPSGGTLIVGNNRLIVPPGALLVPTAISGVVPDDTVEFIHFEPHGLQFRKPAGLVLDATGCDLSGAAVPDVVYVDDGQIVERIAATYDNSWHTVAAPIHHFSGYAIAF